MNRGPLTYSIKIGEKAMRVGGTDKWPALEIHPIGPWNYGLVLDEKDPSGSFDVVQAPGEIPAQPFVWDASPIELRAKARRIPGWKQDRLGLVGLLRESPVKSDEPMETVALVPMGCTRLRIASIPVIGDGPIAHEWPEPPAPTVQHTASHCYDGDTVNALSDGLEPKNSNDHDIPRFTWWPHLGTSEWVTYELQKPKKVSEIEVYWFDDTGVGQCRVPKSCRVEYRDGSQWKPVQTAAPCRTAKDQFNRAAFEPVTTSQLRLVVKLQPGFSAGVLEWKVK